MAAIMRQIAELLYNDYEANQADTEKKEQMPSMRKNLSTAATENGTQP